MSQLVFKKLLAIFSLYLLNSVLAQTNPKCKGRRYICSQILNIESTLCAQIIDDKNKKIELWNCPTGYSCDLTSFTNKFAYCQKDADPDKTLPGESCSEDIDCYSKSCKSGVCVGAQANEACSSHSDCDVGYYCLISETGATTGVCTEQVTFGKQCLSDYDCQNNCVCSKGTCTYYYSLDNGIAANNEKACASGYVQAGKCAQGYSSKDPSRPKPCSDNEECVVVDSEGKPAGITECQCGYNPGSFSYCKLSEGDQEYKDILTAFLFVLNTNFHCHTSLRYGPCKYIYDDEYREYHRAINLFQMAPQVTYNDYCIKRAFNWKYWVWLSSDLNSFSLLSFVFIIYTIFI